MATTIEALRKLGKKVNDKEPTSNGIGNIVNEIADDYAGGSGSAGVSSIGGVDGAITLGEGLSMSGQELQVSVSGGGGTQLYRHSVTINVDDDETATIDFITLTANAYTSCGDLGADISNIIKYPELGDGASVYSVKDNSGTYLDLYMTTPVYSSDISGSVLAINVRNFTFISDAVNAI